MKISAPLPSPVRALALATLLLACTQCSVSEQVKESPSGKNMTAEALETQAYGQVQYRLNSVDEASLGGQNIVAVRQATDLPAPQQAQLQTALQSGSLPLHLKLRVFARNPSPANLQLRQLDYQLLLDGQELAAGTAARDMTLEASSIQTIPLAVDVALPADKLGAGAPAFAAGLTDLARPDRRLTLRMRPQYVSASGRAVPPTAFEPVEMVAARRSGSKK